MGSPDETRGSWHDEDPDTSAMDAMAGVPPTMLTCKRHGEYDEEQGCTACEQESWRMPWENEVSNA